jgi:hypothetical protein
MPPCGTIGPFAFATQELHTLRVKIALLFITLAVLASAQVPAADHQKNVGIDCSILENAKGCNSYNEMFVAKDKDLLESFDYDEAYVCFPEYFDDFFIIAFSQPLPRDFQALVKGIKAPLLFPGYIVFKSYRSGVSDDTKNVIGNWQRWNEDTIAFEGKNKNASATVVDSEISIDISFKNVAGGTTDHDIQVRRSTLRFTDKMQWDDPPKTPKSEPDKGSTSQSGHCKLFSKSTSS